MNAVLTPVFIADIKQIIDAGVKTAYMAVNSAAILTYWNIGKRIVEEEQGGNARAEYGKRLIDDLANNLVPAYGNGFSARRLRDYRLFYLTFKDFEIWHSRVPNLTWSHFRRILSVATADAREWYVNEASAQRWSVRTLDRNISTQYYGRRMACIREHLPLPSPVKAKSDPIEYLKNPVVAEFLGFNRNTKYCNCSAI